MLVRIHGAFQLNDSAVSFWHHKAGVSFSTNMVGYTDVVLNGAHILGSLKHDDEILTPT